MIMGKSAWSPDMIWGMVAPLSTLYMTGKSKVLALATLPGTRGYQMSMTIMPTAMPDTACPLG